MTREQLLTFALTLPILLASMALHEIAHGAAALRLGDPTAKMLGRLSPNPVRHLDPLGTAMFFITYAGGVAAGIDGFAIGWAKPVPVVPEYFRRPQRGMAIVAVAGPLVNFAVALLLAAAVFHAPIEGRLLEVAVLALLVNVVLGVFNLLPVPPLDGSRVVGAFLSRDAWLRWMALDRYGILAILALVLVFNRQFQEILGAASDAVLEVLAVLVGGSL